MSQCLQELRKELEAVWQRHEEALAQLITKPCTSIKVCVPSQPSLPTRSLREKHEEKLLETFPSSADSPDSKASSGGFHRANVKVQALDLEVVTEQDAYEKPSGQLGSRTSASTDLGSPGAISEIDIEEDVPALQSPSEASPRTISDPKDAPTGRRVRLAAPALALTAWDSPAHFQVSDTPIGQPNPGPLKTAWPVGLRVVELKETLRNGGLAFFDRAKEPEVIRMGSRESRKTDGINMVRSIDSPISKRRLERIEASLPRWQGVLRSQRYELSAVALILLGTAFVAWEADWWARNPKAGREGEHGEKEPAYFVVLGAVLFMLFLLDIIFRIGAERSSIWLSRNFVWNSLDLVLMTLAFVEVVIQWCEQTTHVTMETLQARTVLRKLLMFRTVRLLHVIRGTRSVFVLRFARELRLMLFSLTGAVKSLIWAVLLICFVILIFSVFLTDSTVGLIIEDGAGEASANAHQSAEVSVPALESHFGTIPKAALSLYSSMSGGEEWINVWNALGLLPPEYKFAFLVFITLAVFSVVNVVTAIFVDAATERTRHDRELNVLNALERQQEMSDIMQKVFRELDEDNSGCLTAEEFEKHIEDEKIAAYLSTLEIEISEARTLFKLLDTEKSGVVDLQDFVSGCLRMRGGASGLDIAVLKSQADSILEAVIMLEQHMQHLRTDGQTVMLSPALKRHKDRHGALLTTPARRLAERISATPTS